MIQPVVMAAHIVALRKESVDRNFWDGPALLQLAGVALRKESVDRNLLAVVYLLPSAVALRKESVDRNCFNH